MANFRILYIACTILCSFKWNIVLPEPKISVIIPVYNTERFLKACLDSVLNQSMNDIEIICINDASNDNSAKILQEYAKKDKRIKIVSHQKNEGMSVSRNDGISIAAGKYVSFIDSDDYAHRDMLKIMHAEIEKSNADVAVCHFCKKEESHKPDFKPIAAWNVQKYNGCDFVKEASAGVFSVCFNRLYKKSIVDRVKFIPNLIYEDMCFNICALKFIKKYVVIDSELYCYRLSSSSVMRSGFSYKKVDSLCEIIKIIADFPETELPEECKSILCNDAASKLISQPIFNGTCGVFLYACRKINDLHSQGMIEFKHLKKHFIICCMFAMQIVIGKLLELHDYLADKAPPLIW